MKIKIKSPHYTPKYQTSGACAFDFEAIQPVLIEPRSFGIVDTGVVIKVPEGTCLVTAPRSSLFKNLGLIQVNSIWIIDQDYCGDNDTIKFMFHNMRDTPCSIGSWLRIGQGMFVKIEKPEFEMVESMQEKDRGGFGTTWL
jgi:dUTP pyrophosphatase